MGPRKGPCSFYLVIVIDLAPHAWGSPQNAVVRSTSLRFSSARHVAVGDASQLSHSSRWAVVSRPFRRVYLEILGPEQLRGVQSLAIMSESSVAGATYLADISHESTGAYPESFPRLATTRRGGLPLQTRSRQQTAVL